MVKFQSKSIEFFEIFFALIIIIVLSSISDIVYSQDYESEIVLKAQKNLQELGYNPGPLDGIYGKKTQRALKKFQHDNDLSITGKLDSMTKEKLNIISSAKSVPKRNIPVISIQGRIIEALKNNWEIKKVQIENDRITVIPNIDLITKQKYASMILKICRHARVPNQFKQIWILNASQNQGWVLLQTEKCCRQIMYALSNQVNKLIFRYSADVLIFETR